MADIKFGDIKPIVYIKAAAPTDVSLPRLVELLNKGYDKVRWIGSKRDKEDNDICRHYDQAGTTWDLAAFLNMNGYHINRGTKEEDTIDEEKGDGSVSLKTFLNHPTIRKAAFEMGFKITAESKLYRDMPVEEQIKVIDTPQSAYNYIKEHNYKDLPPDVVDTVAKDSVISGRFLGQFFKNNQNDEVPGSIVKAVQDDADFVAYMNDMWGEQANFPWKEVGEYAGRYTFNTGNQFVREFGKSKEKYEESDAQLLHNAPIYEHSHVGCTCIMAVFKEDDPGDVVFVNRDAGDSDI